MGSILLVPAVLSILQNPRTIDLSSGWGFLTYSKPQQYLAILLSWVLHENGTTQPLARFGYHDFKYRLGSPR